VGCDEKRCIDLSGEIYNIVAIECTQDIDLGDETCTEVQLRRLECTVSCMDGQSCAAIRGDDKEASLRINACVNYCIQFSGM